MRNPVKDVLIVGTKEDVPPQPTPKKYGQQGRDQFAFADYGRPIDSFRRNGRTSDAGTRKNSRPPHDNPPNVDNVASTDTQINASEANRGDIRFKCTESRCSGVSNLIKLPRDILRHWASEVNCSNIIPTLSQNSTHTSGTWQLTHTAVSSVYPSSRSIGPVRNFHRALDALKCSTCPRICCDVMTSRVRHPRVS